MTSPTAKPLTHVLTPCGVCVAGLLVASLAMPELADAALKNAAGGSSGGGGRTAPTSSDTAE
jgi:hypothetical protein